MTGPLAGGLALLGCAAPLLLDGPIPWGYGALAALVLAAVAGAAAHGDVLRTPAGVLLTGWVVLCVAVGDGPVLAVAVVAGTALRAWAGVPELLRLGRSHVADLATELAGGAAAAGLVAVAAERSRQLPPSTLLLALVAAGLLVGTATRVLRR